MSNYNIPTDDLTQELQRIGALIATGQLPPAAQALTDARKRYGEDSRIYMLGARLAEKAGNAAGALQAAERAQKVAPEWHVATMELALLLMRQGKHQEALVQARKGVRLAPEDLEVVRRAAGIAIRANNLEATLAWLRKAVSLKPSDRLFRTLLARQLLHAGKSEEAFAMYDALVPEQPWETETLIGRAKAALALGRLEQARQDAEALLQLEPGNTSHQYLLAQARGEQPTTQPEENIKALFNGFAETFDITLWRQLEYRVPQMAAEILLNAYPDRKFNLLDLGCGTGLVGVCLGRIDGFIIGVDLSEEMISKAAQHNVYARFHQVNVLDALRDTPSNHYEAITCCDVLVYVGDLYNVIPNALRILKPGGHFVFSCEAAGEDEQDLVLRPTERYAHKASAVRRMCEQAGFGEVTIEDLPSLRKEGGQPLPGFLVTARKNPVAS